MMTSIVLNTRTVSSCFREVGICFILSSVMCYKVYIAIKKKTTFEHIHCLMPRGIYWQRTDLQTFHVRCGVIHKNFGPDDGDVGFLQQANQVLRRLEIKDRERVN